jgi:hypothetical protein
LEKVSHAFDGEVDASNERNLLNPMFSCREGPLPPNVGRQNPDAQDKQHEEERTDDGCGCDTDLPREITNEARDR